MLDLIQAYENYLLHVKMASSNTVCSYIRDIRQYSDWLSRCSGTDLAEAKQEQVRDYLTFLQEQGNGIQSFGQSEEFLCLPGFLRIRGTISRSRRYPCSERRKEAAPDSNRKRS